MKITFKDEAYRCVCELQYGSRSVPAILDTGATVSHISKNLISDLMGIDMENVDREIRKHNFSESYVYGGTIVPKFPGCLKNVRIGGMYIDTLYIMQASVVSKFVLIGYDFYNSFKTVYKDCDGNTVLEDYNQCLNEKLFKRVITFDIVDLNNIYNVNVSTMDKLENLLLW